MLWVVDGSAPGALRGQIAANVRRAVADGALVGGERLQPASELATILNVNANTVLQAYRRLRDEGLLEFRRGRGVQVRADAAANAAVVDAAHHLVEICRRYGYSVGDLAALLGEL